MFSFKRLLKLAALASIILLLSLLVAYISIKDQLPSVNSLKNVKWQTPMQIFSADGLLLNQFGENKRIPLKLEEMPQQLINAILATEDDRFYMHFGVDPIGMTRAVIGQIMGQNKGGASTITMQVARNFFLTREQTYIRKLREIFTSFHIESLLTKDEILALYMNKIPLGHRAFGFGAAAQVYYNKDVKDLTLAQIAVLAGLPKAPSTINPIRSPKRAKARRAVVLHRMLVSGYITQEEYVQARNAPITAKKHGAEIELSAPYIAEMAHQEVVGMFGREEAYTGGYKVFTTAPSLLQKSAQKALRDNLHSYDQRHGYRGALYSLRPEREEDNSLQLPPNAVLQTEMVKDMLTEEEIVAAFKSEKEYNNLKVAVITDIQAQVVTAQIRTGEININWDGLSWARTYISDEKQGPAPKQADEIVKIGDVVYVELVNDEYKLSQLPRASSALVSLDPYTGAIKSAVGGYSFEQSQFNRVTQAKRQVGSNIKPFIYSAALENGFTLASLVNDAPINQWDRRSGVVWRPKNSPAVYNGPIRIREALARSKNVVAVRLFRKVGINNIINHLASFGFAPDELPRDESLALGSASLTPLEIATGFAVFSNGGYLVTPYIIDRIEDAFGNIVYKAKPTLACDSCTPESLFSVLGDAKADYNEQKPVVENELNQNTNAAIKFTDTNVEEVDGVNQDTDERHYTYAERAISSQNAFLITEALNSAIWDADWSASPGWQGTGWRARALKRRDIAGKTGTTNQARDAWFSGYSNRVVTTSWIGFDDPNRNLGRSIYNNNLGKDQITGNEFGAKSAQPAWITYMKTALSLYPPEPFEPPENIISVRIDKATGKLTNSTDRKSLFEYFELGSAPTEYVTQDISDEIINGSGTEEDPETDIF